MKTLPNYARLSTLIVAGFLTLTLSGCSKEEVAEKDQPQVQTIQAKVQTVELGNISLTAVVPGAVVPDQRANISSRLMGFIKKLDLKVGHKVEKGDLLFSLDSGDVNSAIAQAQSSYDQARATFVNARQNFKRFERLYKEASISRQQFDTVSLQYKVAKEGLAGARSALSQAKDQLKYVYVKAPFSGVVVNKMAVVGDLAMPGQPVLVIENLKSLSIQTQVARDLFTSLRSGDEVEVLLEGKNEPILATIYTLVAAADPVTRTHIVKLSLPDVGNINSGTFARINFNLGERQTLLIPKTAVLNRSGIEGVFVVQEGVARFRMVRLGEKIGELVEVQAGLSLGDVIVVENNQSMLNGDLVEVVK